MHIGLDYDETVTADPHLWQQVVQLFLRAGHQVSLVSIRPLNQPNTDLIEFSCACGIPMFTTNGMQKAPYMAAEGCPVDIWIDDAPETIPSGTTLLGMAIGCMKQGEPVDPDAELPGYITLKEPLLRNTP